MILRKNKKCNECGRDDQPLFSKGRCKGCASKSYGKPKKSAPKIKNEDLDEFFKYHIAKIEQHPFCQECGCRIIPSHFHVAHILPKSKYKSIASNINNAMYYCTSILGSNGCHEDFDKCQNDINYVESMRSVDEILQKFRLMEPDIAEEEKRHKEYQVLKKITNN